MASRRKPLHTASGTRPADIGRRIRELYERRAPAAMDAAAMAWQRKTILLLSQRGTGRRYGAHVASAPGEPPARDTGEGVRSIGWERVGRTLRRLGSGLEKMKHLDRGTRTIKPRPWVLPSLSAAGPAMVVAIRGVLARG